MNIHSVNFSAISSNSNNLGDSAGLYHSADNKNSGLFFSGNKRDSNTATIPGLNPNSQNTTKLNKSLELRQHIRSLYRTETSSNPYAMKTDDIVSSLYGNSDEQTDETLKHEYTYNYKEVTTKIQRAKTSAGATQAVLAAKRKVAEIRMKMANSKGDAKELQLALTHAKRIEMVAKKKKMHLENEELVKRTLNRDKEENTKDVIGNTVIDQAEEKLSKAADDIFEEREEIFDDALEEITEGLESISDEELAALNEMVSQIGEDILEELEEEMEMLAGIEIINPHMSEENFNDLKLKHRSSEDRDIVKADTEYIKDLTEYRQTSLVDITV